MRRCYGESYFDGVYYDADALRRLISEGRQYSAVALNEAGEVVAHIGLRRPRGGRTADSTMAIVDPLYRSRGLLVQVGAAMGPAYLELGLCGLYLQAVTVHAFTQQASLKGGSGVVGLYLDYIPRGMTFLEIESAVSNDPTPALIMLQPLGPLPERRIHLPRRYEAVILDAIAQCGLQRGRSEALHATPSLSRGGVSNELKSRQQVCYLWVSELGADTLEQVRKQMRGLPIEELNVVYLQLPLDAGPLDETIDLLREEGFFYAGYLPEYGERDWLTLQKVTHLPIDRSNVMLADEHSYELLDFIIRDQRSLAGSR
jgi:serine/threonine-protein kinase RsbW